MWKKVGSRFPCGPENDEAQSAPGLSLTRFCSPTLAPRSQCETVSFAPSLSSAIVDLPIAQALLFSYFLFNYSLPTVHGTPQLTPGLGLSHRSQRKTAMSS